MASNHEPSNNDCAEGSSELNQILKRRQSLNDAMANGEKVEHVYKKQTSKNVYVEFQEYSRKEIKQFEKKFQS